jgi:hypothetical protein
VEDIEKHFQQFQVQYVFKIEQNQEYISHKYQHLQYGGGSNSQAKAGAATAGKNGATGKKKDAEKQMIVGTYSKEKYQSLIQQIEQLRNIEQTVDIPVPNPERGGTFEQEYGRANSGVTISVKNT